MIKITDLLLPLSYDLKMLEDTVVKRLNIGNDRIKSIKISKRSVDTKDKQNIHFNITVLVNISGDEDEVVYSNKHKGISKETELRYIVPDNKKLKKRPIIVGCGPAGMFAALILAEAGARPIVLERGADVDTRRKNVLKFWQSGTLDINSNVQFGEGGAGTFSDGKLKIGMKTPLKTKILSEFIEAGAPPEIMYVSKPHIGTDRLHAAVKAMRLKIISLGGEVYFNSTVTRILHKDGRVNGVGYIKEGKYSELEADFVIAAIGHSAHDTFEKFLSSGIIIEQKAFSVGVRIEHPQEMINKIQYADFAGHPNLGAADYRMVVHLQNGRGVYTFCMCPGGSVVAAASEHNGLVTNGMSEYRRDGRNANCVLLVTVDRKDIGSDTPLGGISFKRGIEKAAYEAGGGGYKAPVQRLEDFLNRRNTTAFGDVLPTYLPGTEFAGIDSYMPEYIADSLRQGIKEMGDWMPGFNYPDALLTGAETRSSSPVRITRGSTFEAIGKSGLYPCGEGAGYAGGIISAAVDGVLCAEKILCNSSIS